MASVLLAFTMSLDGFVAGPDVSLEHPMGKGGERLHDWLFKSEAEGADATMARELASRVGAVVLGKTTFDVGLPQWGDTPYPAPSFVLTNAKREPMMMKSGAFTFVNDGIASALAQAIAAAGERDVVVMGAHTARQFLRAGLVDEMYIQLAPRLLGAGSRLFDGVGPGLEFEIVSVVASPFVTHLVYKVGKGGGQGV